MDGHFIMNPQVAVLVLSILVEKQSTILQQQATIETLQSQIKELESNAE